MEAEEDALIPTHIAPLGHQAVNAKPIQLTCSSTVSSPVVFAVVVAEEEAVAEVAAAAAEEEVAAAVAPPASTAILCVHPGLRVVSAPRILLT